MNQPQIDENREYIASCFTKTFSELDYYLKSADMNAIIYGNDHSELIFIYDMQQYGQMIFMNLHIKNTKTQNQFDIKTILDSLFEINTKQILEEYHKKQITQEKTYSLLVEKYLFETIKSNDFSWEEKLIN